MKIDSVGNIGCIYKFYHGYLFYDAIVEPNNDVVLFATGASTATIDTSNPAKRFQIPKVDSNGNQIWFRQYGFDTITTSGSYFYGIVKNPIDDGYIVYGNINNKWHGPKGDIIEPLKGGDDIWIGFLNHNGDLIGQLSYGVGN